MFCKKCGNENEDAMKYCKNCGTPVETLRNGKQNSRQIEQGVRIGMITTSLLMALSTVLPYMVFHRDIAAATGIKSVTLLMASGDQIGDGIIYILLAVAAIVFVCLRKKIPVLVCGVLSALIYWYETFQMKKQYSEMFRGNKIDIWDYMDKGSGYHLLMVSVILLLALSVFYFVLEKQKGIKK